MEQLPLQMSVPFPPPLLVGATSRALKHLCDVACDYMESGDIDDKKSRSFMHACVSITQLCLLMLEDNRAFQKNPRYYQVTRDLFYLHMRKVNWRRYSLILKYWVYLLENVGVDTSDAQYHWLQQAKNRMKAYWRTLEL